MYKVVNIEENVSEMTYFMSGGTWSLIQL